MAHWVGVNFVLGCFAVHARGRGWFFGLGSYGPRPRAGRGQELLEFLDVSRLQLSLLSHLLDGLRLHPVVFGSLLELASKLAPYLLVWIAFTFVYLFVPNTRVRVGSAAVGAFFAALAWQTTGWGFAAFIASSARFPAIYSSFAILILLLIWLYLSWFILLLGSQVAFYIQNPRYVTMKPVRLVLSNRMKERLALGITTGPAPI